MLKIIYLDIKWGFDYLGIAGTQMARERVAHFDLSSVQLNNPNMRVDDGWQGKHYGHNPDPWKNKNTILFPKLLNT